ncbi:uncharacterized protein RHOBADRAFT_54826 [Rhodotorula graminis WP1]|uniref:Uncharacterized protein n=1 Tax=Rhodotorula graminis (strain WP1) TaxID=578459 RepID=A0A0P9EJA1_RHOGW|nr:uncharacterized protein RHOBADRAFT_54826 [Rhodotorula graminis WP1]KPV73628.1 hypothetical protein RHOBADRAFT_54826 [Rhodotorula graminis WP1]
MSDPRFARLHTDPRFVRPKASKTKFVVDDRFKQLFEDQQPAGAKKSKLARKVDKYGRPLDKEASVNELKRYYRMASPSADDAQVGEEQAGEDEEGEEASAGESAEEEEEDEPARPGFVDLARGEVLLESSDEEAVSDAESDSSSRAGSVRLGGRASRRRPSRSPSIDLSETEPASLFPDEDDSAAELDDDDDDDEGAEPSRRLAIVNMDWDHLRASDLYRVLASCLSATAASIQQRKEYANDNRDAVKIPTKLAIAPGRLKSLRIYPSQFGRERMEREAVEGPPVDVLRAKVAESSDEDEDDGGKTLKLGRKDKGKQRRRRADSADEGDDFTTNDLIDEQLQEGDDYDTEALRKYQLERLRYYYAIATFDTVASAKHVVEQINGTEFERTANIFDLQYVPDDTSFDDDPVHDEATEASIAAEGNSYTGIDFQTDALRHSKVKLTWDADDPHRKTKLETYLASALDRSKQKGATKGKAKIGEDDIAQYLASSSDEDDVAENGEDEHDDFFEAEEPTAPAAPAAAAPAKAKKETKRERLRSLLGLAGGDGESEVTWDGGAVAGGKQRKGADAGMQITFAPALSERSAKQLEFAGGDERQETSIEAYKRKEKERRERKKLERRARNEGKTVEELLEEEGMRKGASGAPLEPREGDAGFDDDFFADDGEDPFAAYDDGGKDSGDEIGGVGAQGKKGDKLSKKAKREQREAEEKANAEEHAKLALLVGSDDEDDVGGAGGEGGRHFDMRKILKSEKNAGKKHKVKGKGKKALDKDEPVNDEFKLDLGDDRFKSLYEDYDYAVDPSNPRYQKSRNMEALLTEGRKRRAAKTDKVQSVKRKAGDVGGRGKRTKV